MFPRWLLATAVALLVLPASAARAGWSTPQRIVAGGDDEPHLRFAGDERGDAVLMWSPDYDDEDTRLRYATSTRGGRFTRPRRIGGSQDGEFVFTSIDPRGGIVFAWFFNDHTIPADPETRDEDCCYRLTVAQRLPSGRMTRPRRVSSGGRTLDLHDGIGLDVSQSGTWGAAWTEQDAGFSGVYTAFGRPGASPRIRRQLGFVSYHPWLRFFDGERADVAWVDDTAAATVARRADGSFGQIGVLFRDRSSRASGRDPVFADDGRGTTLVARSAGDLDKRGALVRGRVVVAFKRAGLPPGPDQVIATGPPPDRDGPRVIAAAMARNGAAAVLLERSSRMQISLRAPGGRFRRPVYLAPGREPDDLYEPKLAVGADGTFAVLAGTTSKRRGVVTDHVDAIVGDVRRGTTSATSLVRKGEGPLPVGVSVDDAGRVTAAWRPGRPSRVVDVARYVR